MATKKAAKPVVEVETQPIVEQIVEQKSEEAVASPAPQAAKAVTMEELLAQSSKKIVVPQKGDKVSGVVTFKDKKKLVIDIGAKTEGIVADKEFAMAAEFIDDINVGDTVDAHVVSSETDRGQIVLSLKKAAMDSKWERFYEAFKNDEAVEVKGIDVNKGGLIVLADTIRGFVPSSQFSTEYMTTFTELKGKSFPVKVIEVDQEKNRLIFSERHVSEAAQLAQRDQALKAVKAGAIYSGVVSGVMPFGLFVTVQVPTGEVADSEHMKPEEVGFVEGLVHISEISWEKVNHPRDYHKVGDEIKVKVLGIDEDTSKLNLSLKQLQDDPWTEINKEYPIGTTFTGTVSRVEPFGVFVNVEPGVDGLIHASKLDGKHTYTKSEKVTVTVESVDPEQRRMSLSPVLTEVPLGYK